MDSAFETVLTTRNQPARSLNGSESVFAILRRGRGSDIVFFLLRTEAWSGI
jgi:hypothetical protein